MLNRPPLWTTATAAVAFGLSACGGGPVTTTQATAAAPAPRTALTLKSALIELKDLPAGFAIVPSNGGDTDGTASSTDPRCAPLVKLTNADRPPGSKASATVSLSGGQDGPFVDESIDALGSMIAVTALQASYKSAVAACRQLVLTFPGQSRTTMKVAEVPAPKVGEHRFAVRMTATGGPMNGLEITQVTAGVKDVVVSVTFVAAVPGDVEAATAAALGKAGGVLGGAKAGN
jgi:hypothetical protein